MVRTHAQHEAVYDLSIDSMTYGANALGRLEGKAVFVSGAIAGDQAQIRLTEDKGSYCHAEVFRLKGDNPGRQASPCIHSRVCGGCPWMALRYPQQLLWKKQILKDSLQRIAGIDPEDLTVTFTASSSQKNYRNRILLRGVVNRQGITLGYFAHQTRQFTPITDCVIADKDIQEMVTSIQQLACYCDTEEKFRLHLQVLPKLKKEKKAFLLLMFHPVQKLSKNFKQMMTKLQQDPRVLWVGTEQSLKLRNIIVPFEESCGIIYHTSPGIFQQVHRAGNQLLQEKIRSFVEKQRISSILDLYCGSGNLSLHLADKQRHIWGIELDKQAIAVAQHNVRRNHLLNISYQRTSALNFLTAHQEKTFDLVIIDPPRAGIKQDIALLHKISPLYIIYVSCNPTTLARDLNQLKTHYEVIAIEGFDFFPHTFHFESMAFLRKKQFRETDSTH